MLITPGVPFRRRLAGIVLGILIASIAVAMLASTTARAKIVAPSEPWPTFVMTYRSSTEVAPGHTVVQTFRLEYADQRHFRNTVIAHSESPEAVGYTQVFDGSSSTTTDPRFGVMSSVTYGADEVTVPSPWLAPSRLPALARAQGVVLETVAPNLVKATLSQTIGGRSVIEELIYRVTDGIPTLYVVSIDGHEVRHAEVLELTTY